MPEEAQQYGMLIYDVPTKNKKLYVKLWKQIRRRAVRINLSVYLLKWGQKEALQDIIDQAIEEQTALIRFQRFHPDEVGDVENWAVECLNRDIREIVARLTKRIEKANEQEDPSIRPEFFQQLKDDLQNFETLAVMFGFEGNIEGVMDTTRRAIERIWHSQNED